ncbi:MAG: M20/M25/M40 family metallo-hydrolase [Bacteroidales bacterium]
MKRILFFSLAILSFSVLKAQNSAPDILKYGTELNQGSNFVKIVYDLSDKENDDIKITLKISNNGGKDYTFPVGETSGDVGYPVKPGKTKTILWYFPDTVSYNSLISGRFIVRLVADDLHDFDIQYLVDQVDSMALLNDLSKIQGIRHRTEGLAHLNAVKNLIWNKFISFGFYAEKDEFIYTNDDGSKYTAQNLIGKQCGNYDETVYFILDGHYDSVGWGPGADDNGSAVVGVLEAARILSVVPFQKNIRFICFDMEETRIIGSRNYVTNAIPANEQLDGVINFEMIGYYTTRPNSQEIPAGFETLFPDFYQKVSANNFKGDFTFNVANVASNDLKTVFDNCAKQYVPALKVYSLATPGNGDLTPDLRRSDHSNFWDGGYKAIMINDGANFRNLNYHTENDLLDSLNYTFMANNVKAAVATIATLAVPIHGIARWFAINPNSVGLAVVNQEKENNLVQIFPNPFSGMTRIKLTVNQTSKVSIKIFSSEGKLVKEPLLSVMQKGQYEFEISFLDVPPGIYIYNLSGNNQILETGKIIIEKK